MAGTWTCDDCGCVIAEVAVEHECREPVPYRDYLTVCLSARALLKALTEHGGGSWQAKVEGTRLEGLIAATLSARESADEVLNGAVGRPRRTEEARPRHDADGRDDDEQVDLGAGGDQAAIVSATPWLP